MDYTGYVRGAAQVLKVEIPSEYLPGVVDNFASLAQIALLVTEFELPTAEAAAYKPLGRLKEQESSRTIN